jgi:cell division septation protein DedD
MKNTVKLLNLFAVGLALVCYSCGSGEIETGESQQKISGSPETEKITKPETEKTVTDLPRKGLFTIQLGAFVDEANAITLMNSAKKVFGDDVHYSLINDLYKVRFGLFTSETEATVALESIRKKGFEDSFVILN